MRTQNAVTRCFLVLATVFSLSVAAFLNASWGDTSTNNSYGPDWPVCKDLGAAPKLRIETCGRLIGGDKLSKQDLAIAYNNRGFAKHQVNDDKAALIDFNKAIEIDPNFAAPYFNRGWRLYRAGNIDQGIADVKSAIRLEPKEPFFYCHLGQIYDELNRPEEELAAYESGLKKVPNDICLLGSHGNELDRLERYSEAAQDYSRILALDPSREASWLNRALDYIDLGANKAAISDASAALQLDPDDIDALSARGEAYFRDRQYDKARLDCERLLTMRPGDLSCTDFEVRALLLQGQFQDAAGKAGEASDVRGQSHFILMRAIAEYALGSYDLASKDFTAAADADPDDPYRALFKYLADRRLGHDDKGRLADLAERNDIWPTPLAQYVTGHLSNDALFAAADVPDPDIKKQRLAEANFYLGELAALDGHADIAAQYYREAMSIGEIRISARRHMMLYKDHDDYEVALARAALRGNAL